MVIKMIIKNIAYKLGYTKTPIYKKRAEAYRKKQTEIKHQLFLNFGLEALTKMNNVAKELKKPLWLEFGTLLGAYRNKSFIPYDEDIDVGMRCEDYDLEFENALYQAGFKKDHFFYQYRLDGSKILTETTWMLNGISIDIFLLIPSENGRKVYSNNKQDDESFSEGKWGVLEYNHPEILPLEIVVLDKQDFFSPANPVQCLTNYYGETFMTPIKGCSAAKNNPRANIWSVKERYAKICWTKNTNMK